MSCYTSCACRDCFEISIGEPDEAFCHGCEEAGCPDYQGQPGMNQGCQREDAYGIEEPDCVCVVSCDEDPDTACSLSGTLHVHPDNGSGCFGPCPVHPDAPGDL